MMTNTNNDYNKHIEAFKKFWKPSGAKGGRS